jgi:endogenous inhibitor of DNA gyrase (YacG/DUF329 family)
VRPKPAPTTVNCPTCGDLVEWSDEYPWRPFCSDRCRLLDLGAWFEEERAIPDRGPSAPDPIAPEQE